MQMKSMFKLLALALAVQAPAAVFAAEACDRSCLEGFVDKYLDAVVAHKPSAVPIAANARFTEDGQRLVIGDGLWNTMKAKGKYRLFVTDVPAGQVAFIGTIAEDHRDADKSTPALIALRLKVENKTITQIEQLVVRNESAATNVEKAGAPRPAFLKAVPAASRMSRADLIKTANKYFTGMQNNDGKGDYPFADDCNRLENGGLTTNAPVKEGQTRPDPQTSTN